MPIRRIKPTIAEHPNDREVSPPPRARTADGDTTIENSTKNKIAKPTRRRGHATKDKQGKWQPTDDYPTGFARPPVSGRFDGSRPGPGRPKGSRSQDSILKEELNTVRVITMNGEQKKFTQRELAAKLLFKSALEKQGFKELSTVVEMAQRLFPEVRVDEPVRSPFAGSHLDQSIIAQFLAGLEIGEAAADTENPLADAFLAPEPVASAQSEPWQGEDWNSPGMDEGEICDDA